MAPSIREATAADFAAITSIYAYHVLHGTGSFEIDPPDTQTMLSRFNQIKNAQLPYLVAVNTDNEVLGFAYLSAFNERSAYSDSLEDSIYIANEHRGKGLGKLLLSTLIKRATLLGYRQMISCIGDSANQGSVGLHRALGFNHCGTLKSVGFKFGEWRDLVMMQRPLGEGDTRASTRVCSQAPKN